MQDVHTCKDLTYFQLALSKTVLNMQPPPSSQKERHFCCYFEQLFSRVKQYLMKEEHQHLPESSVGQLEYFHSLEESSNSDAEYMRRSSQVSASERRKLQLINRKLDIQEKIKRSQEKLKKNIAAFEVDQEEKKKCIQMRAAIERQRKNRRNIQMDKIVKQQEYVKQIQLQAEKAQKNLVEMIHTCKQTRDGGKKRLHKENLSENIETSEFRSHWYPSQQQFHKQMLQLLQEEKRIIQTDKKTEEQICQIKQQYQNICQEQTRLDREIFELRISTPSYLSQRQIKERQKLKLEKTRKQIEKGKLILNFLLDYKRFGVQPNERNPVYLPFNERNEGSREQ